MVKITPETIKTVNALPARDLLDKSKIDNVAYRVDEARHILSEVKSARFKQSADDLLHSLMIARDLIDEATEMVGDAMEYRRIYLELAKRQLRHDNHPHRPLLDRCDALIAEMQAALDL